MKENNKTVYLTNIGSYISLALSLIVGAGVVYLIYANFTGKENVSTTELILFIALSVYVTFFNFKYWLCNYIKFQNDRIVISVIRAYFYKTSYMKRRSIPKFDVFEIVFSEIKRLSLEVDDSSPTPFILVETKDGQFHRINTKPISKKVFRMFVEKCEAKGFRVQSEKELWPLED